MAAARNLAEHGVEVCVLGLATSVARFSRSVRRFASWPCEMNDDDLPDYLVKMAEKLHIRGSVLFPSCDEHVRILSQHTELLAEYYVLTTPPWETIKFLYDKRLTYRLAREAGVAVPRTRVPGTVDRLAGLDFDFPVDVKPAVNTSLMRSTNRKAYRADNPQELRRLYEIVSRVSGPSQVIVQDILPEPSRNLFSFAGYFCEGEPIVGRPPPGTKHEMTHSGTSPWTASRP